VVVTNNKKGLNKMWAVEKDKKYDCTASLNGANTVFTKKSAEDFSNEIGLSVSLTEDGKVWMPDPIKFIINAINPGSTLSETANEDHPLHDLPALYYLKYVLVYPRKVR
jgi:phage tail sheath gpL-like